MNTDRQLPLQLEHRASLSDVDFLVAPANNEAVNWIDRWPDWPAPALTVSGPTGCGKTHIAHVFQVISQAALISPGTLNASIIHALVDSNRALVIDDADQIKIGVQEESLFHLLNILKEQNKKVLLLAKAAPSRWTLTLPDLQSRLNASPHVAIHNPDEALICAVMVKQFSDRQLRVDAGVIDYLLPRIERSFSSVQSLVISIDRLALAQQRKITIPLVRSVLQSMKG